MEVGKLHNAQACERPWQTSDRHLMLSQFKPRRFNAGGVMEARPTTTDPTSDAATPLSRMALTTQPRRYVFPHGASPLLPTGETFRWSIRRQAAQWLSELYVTNQGSRCRDSIPIGSIF